MNVFLRVLLLISAAVTVTVRFVSFKYSESFSPENQRLLLEISIISAAVCVVCALVWVIQIKKEEKKQKKEGSTETKD